MSVPPKDLEHLKQRMLAMAGAVEEQVRTAVEALVERNHDMAQAVLTGDKPIDQLHLEIDERCFQLLEAQQLASTELRVVVTGVKINSDLERIGDLAINIGETTLRYLEHPSVKPLIDIPRMGSIAQGMLRDSLDSYVKQDMTLAQQVLNRDDQLDELKEQVFHELVGVMCSDTTITEQALDLILISRHLERVGDHATNIAEEAIFMVSGLDVRHQGQEGQANR